MVGVGYEGKKDALARVSLVHITLQQLFVINLRMFPCIFGEFVSQRSSTSYDIHLDQSNLVHMFAMTLE